MHTPLHAAWRITGDHLPERLCPQDIPVPAFRLPGADALMAFADLIGSTPEEAPAAASQEGADFLLPALIPEDTPGEVAFTREIDFGSLRCDTAQLQFDMLCGRGCIAVKSLPPRFSRPGAPDTELITLTRAFDGEPVAMDVTPLLLARRRARITLRFEDARPAGVCGPILLHTANYARIDELDAAPDTAGMFTLSAGITASQRGDYILRAVLCPADAPASPEDAPPLYEARFSIEKGESKTIQLSIAANLPAFVPGQPYRAPGIKAFLYISGQHKGESLCDSAVRMCGFPGAAPGYTLPLDTNDLRQPQETLLKSLSGLHVPGVLLPDAAPDILYRHLTRAGISAVHSAGLAPQIKARLMRYPCTAFARSLFPSPSEANPVLSAWQLCSLVTYPRAADPDLLPAELLCEIAGHEIDPQAEDTQAVLAWLRAFSVRLRAEAMRQGKLTGPLCAPGEYRQRDVAEAIAAALAPVHLSALPLCGAWWTGSRFSASLQAFIPKDVLSVDKSIRACASLEDREGSVIARTEFPCAPWRSGTGLIEAALPDTPCVLELVTRLYADEEILEESTMPVYVGARGALESAF